ncbi:MAG: porin [Pseudomonadales bacterium]|nr:porin [Pseudomonadales bacterium]
MEKAATTMRSWRVPVLALMMLLCNVTVAQTNPDSAAAPAAQDMDMGAIIALLQQQQRELAEQRQRLDAQAGQLTAQSDKITALTRELDALRGVPALHTSPPVQTQNGEAQLAEVEPQGPPAPREEAAESLVTAPGTIVTASPESDSDTPTETAVAAAQADDPTQELLSSFPGAWRLPGTDAAFRVGGFVRTAVVYNKDVLTIPDRFIVGSIPVQQADTKDNAAQSSITANQSRLSFDYRDATSAGILRAFIDGDFTGDNNTFKLRNAFGQWGRVLAGQTWSAFVDTNATPEEVDFEGLNGRINVRQSQIRFSPRIGRDFQAQLSLEDPNPQLQNGNGVTRLPDIVLAGSFQPNNRLHLRTALLGRQIRGQQDIPGTSDLEAGVEKAYAWGLSLSGSFSTPLFNSQDKVLFQLNRGNGIGRYVNDLNSIGNYDGIFDESTGNLQLFNVFAGYGSLQHWWDDSMRSNFTFGWVEINNPGFIDGEAYKRTLRASANIIWNPTEQVDTGLEYLWGRRQNKSGDYGDAQQLQMMIRYIF